MDLLLQETCSQADDIHLIPLNQDQFTEISAIDCGRVAQFKWHAAWYKHAKSFYAVRSVRTVTDGHVTIRIESMARFLLGLGPGDPRQADHIDGDTLNNTRGNLRIASIAENVRNRRRQCNNTSGFKGVSWCRASNKWRACIAVNGKNIHLGLYLIPQLAHEAYCKKAHELHGEFARAG